MSYARWIAAATAVAALSCGNRSSDAPASADEISAAERAAMPGVIAFTSDQDGRLAIWRVRPSGDQRKLLARGGFDYYPGAPAPTNDALIAIATEGPEGAHGEQLALVPLTGGKPKHLGPIASRARNPQWAPDGSWVVFESDANSYRDLYRVDRSGAVTRLTDNKEGNFEPTVAPDGSRIAFVSSRDGDSEIYAMNADGTEAERLTAFHTDDLAPLWSPDGGHIAFVSDREGRDRIFVMKPDGAGQRRLTDTTGDVDEGEMAWDPDGKRLAYVLRGSGNPGVWVVPLAGGKSVRVSPPAVVGEHPTWSPDGRHVAFTGRADGNTDIYIARADGSASVRVTTDEAAEWLPRWVATAPAE